MNAPELTKEPVSHVSGEYPCAHEPTIVCPASKEVASRSWVLTIIGSVLVAVAGAGAGWGGLVYAQAKDAGQAAGVELSAHKLDSAQVHRALSDEMAGLRSDVRALSMQLVTGRQPAQLKTLPDGGTP